MRAADGARLGRVYASDWECIWVRPRFRKTPQFAVPISAVKSLKHGDVILRGGSELLQPLTDAQTHAPLISVRPLSQEEQATLRPE